MGLLFFLYVLMPVISILMVIWACKKIFTTDGNNNVLLNHILTNQIKIMATLQELSEKVDALQTALDEEQKQIKTAIETLEETVASLRDEITNGGGTDEERHALADKIDAIITDLKGTVEPNE